MTLAQAKAQAKKLLKQFPDFASDIVIVKLPDGSYDAGFKDGLQYLYDQKGINFTEIIQAQSVIATEAAKAAATKATKDPGQIGTDKILAEIEAKTHAAYKQAAKELEAKAEKQWDKLFKKYNEVEQQLNKGEITKAEFDAWFSRQSAMAQQMTDLAEVLAKDLHKTNQIAAKIATDSMADVYALNANYAMYDIFGQAGTHPHFYDWAGNDIFDGAQMNMGASFLLYNHDTAELLLKTEWSVAPEKGKNSLLPAPSKKKLKELKALKATNPDQLWDQKHLESAILQGVLQGEPSWKIAKRLSGVATMDERQAIRNARTMTTNVQNMGRQRSYLNAKDMGIDLVIEWCANLDGVTRDSHRHLHGERRNNTKTGKFSNGCRWPGDPQGPAAEVYNCRCTTLSWVKGFEHDKVTDSPYLQDKQMTFEEWQNAMKKASSAASVPTTAPAPAAKSKKTTAKTTPQPTVSQTPTPAPAPKPKPTTKKPTTDPYKDAIANAQEFTPHWHKHGGNFSEKFWRSLTDEEREGVVQYTGSSYVSMNDYLRGVTSRVSLGVKKLIDGCTSALNKHEISEDTLLYRGMGSYGSLARSLGINRDDINKIVSDGSIKGMRFVEKGFCSTGVSQAAGWSKSVTLEIVAPKGTKGLYVDPISRHQGEKELLLQRGTIFEIREAKMDYGNVRLKVVVVGNEPVT